MEAKATLDVVKSNSPRETQQIAQNLGKTLKVGDIIALYGELGAGKTVFVKGIARSLNIKNKITSPTFVFMRSYPIKLKQKPLMFYHLDLYRGQSEDDFESLGLEEIISWDNIVVVEWADKIKSRLPNKRIDVHIENIDEQSRRIKIKRT